VKVTDTEKQPRLYDEVAKTTAVTETLVKTILPIIIVCVTTVEETAFLKQQLLE
jgi:hypothetical protein